MAHWRRVFYQEPTEYPFVAIKPGKKRPQNLGQGCVPVVGGVSAALLQFLDINAMKHVVATRAHVVVG